MVRSAQGLRIDPGKMQSYDRAGPAGKDQMISKWPASRCQSFGAFENTCCPATWAPAAYFGRHSTGGESVVTKTLVEGADGFKQLFPVSHVSLTVILKLD